MKRELSVVRHQSKAILGLDPQDQPVSQDLPRTAGSQLGEFFALGGCSGMECQQGQRGIRQIRK